MNMSKKEAVEILKYYDEQPYFFSKDASAAHAFKMAISALEESENAVVRFVNWVDDHYNTEIHLERSDEYKTIHDFYEEFMDEMQREREEERD